MIQNDEVEEYLRAVAGSVSYGCGQGGARPALDLRGGQRGVVCLPRAVDALGDTDRRDAGALEPDPGSGTLPLRGRERAAVVDWLFERLGDDAGLVRTMALQALFDLSASDTQLRNRVLPFPERLMEMGTAAMRIRARNLLGSRRVSSE